MEYKSRKKSINLLLFIFILLLLISLTILTIFLINQYNNKKISTTQENLSNQTNNNVAENSNSNIYSPNSSLNDISNNITSEPIYSSPINNTFTLNDHTFKFENNLDVSIFDSSNIPQIQVISNDFGYKMILNTNKLISFKNLKEHTDLTNFIISTFNIDVTSDIKYGTLKNTEIIVCTIKDNDLPAYFIITKLDNDEILYAKIYNISDTNSLIYDLSIPINTLSNIISSVQ